MILRCILLPDTVTVHVQLSLRSRLLHFFTSPPPCESSSAAFVVADPTAPTGAPQHRNDPTDMRASLDLPLARAPTRRLRPRTLSTLCVLLCLDPLCVALFVRPNGHPEPEQALPTARGIQGGPRATAG